MIKRAIRNKPSVGRSRQRVAERVHVPERGRSACHSELSAAQQSHPPAAVAPT